MQSGQRIIQSFYVNEVITESRPNGLPRDTQAYAVLLTIHRYYSPLRSS